MKSEIHPEYGPVTVQCACGNTFQTKSTLKGTIQIDVCSACHSFYTGKQKLMDTAGRIDRFKRKFQDRSAQTVKASKPEVKREPRFGEKLTLREKLAAAKAKAASQIQQ
jgi:large subunit ribosomal protein L31